MADMLIEAIADTAKAEASALSLTIIVFSRQNFAECSSPNGHIDRQQSQQSIHALRGIPGTAANTVRLNLRRIYCPKSSQAVVADFGKHFEVLYFVWRRGSLTSLQKRMRSAAQ
ncbi:MAG: hypothetical protein NTX50_03440 [Candidatus Sumerlaeota bacterium]|nr:hypothetical protein [Candidatus Sumerlaeota bacterium]